MVKLEAHPPERGGSRSITLACGCSCCCCCCLHTVGSVVGAGVGSRTPAALRAAKAPEANESRSSAKKLYWLSLLFVSAVVPGIYFASETPHDVEEAFLVVGAILLGALPLVQLGASLVTAILLGVAPATVIPAKGEAFRALARITLGTVIGAVIGSILVAVIFSALVR